MTSTPAGHIGLMRAPTALYPSKGLLPPLNAQKLVDNFTTIPAVAQLHQVTIDQGSL